MQAGTACRLDHLLRIHLAKTCNVLGNQILEQFDILGQIAQARPQFLTAQPAKGRSSSSTSPVMCGQMPIMQRASVDLPDPEGPSTTVTEPGSARRLTP